MSDLYTEQHKTAEYLVRKTLDLRPNTNSIVCLAGGVGSGRTTVMDIAKQGFGNSCVHPIYVPTLEGQFDSAAMMTAKIIDSLHPGDITSDDKDLFKKPQINWTTKFTRLSELLEAKAENYVLLLDDPVQALESDQNDWRESPDDENATLINWFFRGTKLRRVVTGKIPKGLPRFGNVRVPAVSDEKSFLEDPRHWDGAAGSARQISDVLASMSRRDPGNRNVMEIRLSVANCGLFSSQFAADQLARAMNAFGLLELLLSKIEQGAFTEARFHELSLAMARLSLARLKWTEDAFNEVTSSVQPLDRSIIRSCLCEEWPDGIVLHPLVRYRIAARSRNRNLGEQRNAWRLDPDDHTATHEKLFHTLNSKPGTSLTDDAIFLHHGRLAGKIDFDQARSRIHFVEQLQEIGFALSYRHGKHDQAASVYRLAVSIDETNARSHHYLAFNLDWDGVEADDVETHYVRAIEEQPDHPWWHSRWISYLVTRGQNKKARQAWQKALQDLGETRDIQSLEVCLSLHRWVARWMLHWGDLDMVSDVFDSIGPEAKSDPSIKRLIEMMQTLELAEQGFAVFPLSIAKSNWWNADGHTGLPHLVDGRRRQWYPARVEHVDDRTVLLNKGVPKENSGLGFVVKSCELTKTQIDDTAMGFEFADLSEGRYVELGYYDDLGLCRIGLHASLEINDPTLLPLVPPPFRWYEKARDASWQRMSRGQA